MKLPQGIVAMNDYYDALTVEVINRVCGPESLCVDVGAGGGELLQYMLKAAPRGHHVALDPVPECASRLRRDFQGVIVWQVAASEGTGTSPYVWVSSNPGYSGLQRRPYDREDETLESISVVTARLDDLVPPAAQVDLIKIDVEGGELGVLRGAPGILGRCRPVIVLEHGGDHVTREYGVTTDDLWAYLSGFGYRLWTLPGFTSGSPSLSRDELDGELRTHWYYVAAHEQCTDVRQEGL